MIKTIVITLFVYWTIGFIVFACTKENERFTAYWTCGLVYWILWLLCAPYRIIKKWRDNQHDKT